MKRLLSLTTLLLMAVASFAHDFEVNGIYYKIISSTSNPPTVSVSFRGIYSSDYENEYSSSVTIPESVLYSGKTYKVTSIGSSAFKNCSSLTNIIIPSSVMTIGKEAFSGCKGLTSITIPTSVTIIGEGAFSGCSGLTSITIPSSVTTIGKSAFSECSGLTSVNIPSSVMTMGESVFAYCTGLSSVIISEGVTNIPDRAFNECYNLISISIPNSVTSIGSWAFQACWKLNSITIPNGVTRIPMGAFRECTNISQVIIPNSVTTISSYAFSSCRNLTSMIIPNSVTTIESFAFENCYKLKSIAFSSNITSISYCMFKGCVNLTNFTIPSSVQNIDSSAFENCSSLTSITIPSSVTSIGSNVFSGCSKLNSVVINSSNVMTKNYSSSSSLSNIFGSQVKEYIIGEGVRNIGDYVFYDSVDLMNITLPEGIISIGNSAFAGCSSLTSIYIPSNVTTIGNSAFYGCRNLNSITIPQNVSTIGSSAFGFCRLNSLVSLLETPFDIEAAVFIRETMSYHFNSTTLFVPANSRNKYQNTSCWNRFSNIIEFGNSDIKSLKEPQEIDYKTYIPQQIELKDIVIGDTYYNLDSENGDTYNPIDGSIDFVSETTDEDITDILVCPISDPKVSNIFKGIIFMVPAGSGTVKVTAETIGSKHLMVKIGNNEAKSFSLTEKETVEIPYTVTEPTYVYIYAGSAGLISKSNSITEVEGKVKIYGYEWAPSGSTGLETVNSANNVNSAVYYSIDGKQLSAPQKGLNIIKMSDGTTRKVVK